MKKRKYTRAAKKNADTFDSLPISKQPKRISDIAADLVERPSTTMMATDSGLKERITPSFRAAQLVIEDKVVHLKNQIRQETLEIKARDQKLERKREELYNLEIELRNLRKYNES